jgi:hypothetical protein
MRRGLLLGLLLAVAAVALLRPAGALADANQPVFDAKGQLIEAPLTPNAPRGAQILNEQQAISILEQYPKVAHWLSRYTTLRYGKSPTNPTNATFDPKTGIWNVQIFYPGAGEIAMGKVDDATGHVNEAWTGPQVAWTMARCTDAAGTESDGFLLRPGCGAFGGPKINTPWVWLSFCALFFFGLLDYRKLLGIRTLDLLMLLVPVTLSLWFFNHGNIFTSVPLIYPTLFYALGRMLWIGITGRPTRAQAFWPTWVFVALTVFVGGFRIGLNVEHSNVIDVGYAGVVGASVIVDNHRSPYKNFPTGEADRPACGQPDANGDIRRHIQTNGRCQDAIPQGDTYGPVAYEAYIPGLLAFGWSGFWDDLPAAHFTALFFDMLCALGLALVGKRYGGTRMAAILAFAWMAYPFTQYTSNSNTNDSIGAAFLIFGVWLMHKPAARGALAALAGWTKFAPLLVLGLWLGHPNGLRSRRLGGAVTALGERSGSAPLRRLGARLAREDAGAGRRIGDFVGGFLLATGAAFSVLLLEPSFFHAVWEFWHRTVVWQMGRDAPFSLWDWHTYHARGIPDLRLAQKALQVLLVLGAVVLVFVPRRRSPLQLIAFTGALLVGFECVLTYWLYTYIPWFYPFVAAALLLGTAAAVKPVEPAEEPVVVA